MTLPGWGGLYFQGVGANLVEGFPFEAKKYNNKMIIISTQLNDWGETSANMAIELTEYFTGHYNIDTESIFMECPAEVRPDQLLWENAPNSLQRIWKQVHGGMEI